MRFVGNNAWFAVLLIVHVSGAIMGIGPTFAYGVMGKMAEKDPSMGLAVLKIQEKIEKVVVSPVYFVTQPLTGILLIFNRGLNRDFFSGHNLWLIAALVDYIVIGYLSYMVNARVAGGMIKMIESGNIDGPALMAGGQKLKKVGTALFLLAVVIVVLMIWKPGSGCGPLIRC